MLIMPLEKSIDWSRPPWVTFLFIISCVSVLFLQGKDDEYFKQSVDFYFTSDLPKLELLAYAKDTGDHGLEGLQTVLNLKFSQLKTQQKQALIYFLVQMERDDEFFPKLQTGQIITSQNQQYRYWLVQRQQYEQIQQQSIMTRFAFTPGKHEPFTFISHLFLHGGFGHLLGNMVFLLMVGCAVETALGSMLYLTSYLLTGLGAVALFWLANPESLVPLVGASGAISGVMGMYAGIFGFRKIRIFYSLLFYFNYIKVPALIMLPLWVGHEFYQMHNSPDSNVAFMAHVGGFLAGGLIALLINFAFNNKIDTEYLDASINEDSKNERFRQALYFLTELNISAATRLLSELHIEYPEDRKIFWQLYKTLSYVPDTQQFYQMVEKILKLNDSDTKSIQLINEAFQYYKKAEPGKIIVSAGTLLKLIIKFAKAGYTTDAEMIAVNFLRKKPDIDGLDDALFAVARSWQQQNQDEQCQNVITLLGKYYPEKKYSLT